MEGLQRFLQAIYDNWTAILACVGLILGIIKKTQSYISKSQDEKLVIAKKQIQSIMLKMISDAEVNWKDWNKSGSIKRSEIIQKIYKDYPILSKVADQEEVLKWIDSEIDDSLKILKNIVENSN